MVDPVPVHVHEEDAALHVVEVDARVRLDVLDLLLVFLDRLIRDLADGERIVPLGEFLARDVTRPFGQQLGFERGVEFRLVPEFGHVVHVDRRTHHLFDVVGDIFEHLFVHVRTFKDVEALFVHHLALGVHDVVVLEDVFADAEVPAFDVLLRVLDAVREHLGFQTGIFVDLEEVVEGLHALAAEPHDEFVFEGEEEHGHAHVPLTAGTAAQLVVDAPRFVPLGADDAEAAHRDDLFLFLVRLRLVIVVEFLIPLAHLSGLVVDVLDIHARRQIDDFPLRALFAQPLLGEIFGVAAQEDVRAAPRHVGGDGHRPESARLRDDLRFALVVLRVEDVVLDAVLSEQPGNFLRLIHRRGAHENGLAALVPLDDLVDDRPLFAVDRRIHPIGEVHPLDGLVGRNFDDVQGVDGAEFRLFRLGSTRHARQLGVQAEVVLEGDGGVRLVFASDFHPFFRFDRLVQTVRVPAPDHESAREFVDDDDFAVVDDVVLVPLEQLMRFQRLLDVVIEVGVLDLGDVVDAEEFFRLARARIGELHRLVLAVDDIVPVAGGGERLLPFGCRCRRGGALFLLLRFVIRLFGERHPGEIDRFFLFLLFVRGFGKNFLLLFVLLVLPAFLPLAREFRVLFLFEFVVEPARKGAHESVHLHVQVGGLLPLARDDERRSRFVDEDGVHFVHDREGQIPLHHTLQIRFEVVAEVVEAEFVVGAVHDVAFVRFPLGVVVHARRDDAHRQPHELVHLAHPFRVAAGEIVVDGDDVHALARERVEVGGKGGDERLAFARLHLGDAPLVQADAADDLHPEMLHAQNPPRRFPERRKGVGQNVVRRLPLGEPVFENRRLPFQGFVVHRGVLAVERLHLIRDFAEFFQALSAVAAHQITDQSH